MSSAPTVRPLSPGDVAPLARDLAALPLLLRYGRDGQALAGDLSGALARGDGLLVAESGGALLGLAWFQRSGALGLGAYLRLIAVAPGRERAGTGVLLLRAFEAEAALTGRHAFLLVSDFNGDAQRFYERHGWRRCGALPGLVLEDVAELLYWKRVG
jgi:GNAT superfamily N-acetyltransferase